MLQLLQCHPKESVWPSWKPPPDNHDNLIPSAFWALSVKGSPSHEPIREKLQTFQKNFIKKQRKDTKYRTEGKEPFTAYDVWSHGNTEKMGRADTLEGDWTLIPHLQSILCPTSSSNVPLRNLRLPSQSSPNLFSSSPFSA